MSRRRLSPDERTLWRGVTRSISPLGDRRADVDDEAEPPSPPKSKPKARSVAKPATAAPRAAPRREAKHEAKPEPKPAAPPLGRKARRRLARGSDPIDGRLDLHGMTQAEAHDALLGFLHRSRSRGARVVLVITGKGGGASEGRGVLKRQVPMWLSLPEFRDHVVGFDAASISHGGEGAMYVRLRRRNPE